MCISALTSTCKESIAERARVNKKDRLFCNSEPFLTGPEAHRKEKGEDAGAEKKRHKLSEQLMPVL